MTERNIDISYFKTRLLEMKEEVLQASWLAEGARAPVKLDQTAVGRVSRVDALERQAMAQETERRRVATLKRIEAALKRIEDGEYGYCAVSGEPIPVKRLELDPTALTCVKYAR